MTSLAVPTLEMLKPVTLMEIVRGARRRAALGIGVVCLMFGAAGTWLAHAPLNAAALAPGIVSAESQNKTMQHLEGGIIKEILVAEGAAVDTGQVLVRMDETRASANLQLVAGQLWAALGLEARLAAERDTAERIEFPTELVERIEDAAVAEILRTQAQLFDARRETLAGETAILRQRTAQYGEEIVGLQAQREALDRQLTLVREEIETVRKLVEQGLEKKPRLLALQRASSHLDGERGQVVAQIARARQNIGEMALRITQLSADRLSEVIDELRDVQVQIAELRQSRMAAQDTLDRLELRAPQPGTVVRLLFHTIGGIASPGQPILEFVPRDDRLIVEARLKPEDIGFVHVGLTAEVRIHAYNQRRLPLILGTVIYVSADRLVEARSADKASEQAHYLARVEVDPSSVAALPGAKLFPGMAVDVVVETGERTALDYILMPITTSFRKSFREQ